MIRIPLLALFVLLETLGVSGCNFSNKHDLAQEISSQDKICGRWAEIPVDSSKYLIRNNIWNDAAGGQCIEINSNKPTFHVISTDHTPTHLPASYPSIVKGCHPWGSSCTAGWSSQRLQDIGEVTSNLVIGGTDANGKWNATYDLWINPSSDTKTAPSGTELMIWLKGNGSVVPGGRKVGVTTLREKINGQWQPVQYDIYHASPWSQWQHYVAYHRQTSTEQVEINLKDALDDCVRRGWCQPQWYLVAIEAGFEIWQGGIGLQTENFSASVQVK